MPPKTGFILFAGGAGALNRQPPKRNGPSDDQAKPQVYAQTGETGGKVGTVLVYKPYAVLFEFIKLDISAQQSTVDNGRTGQQMIVFDFRVIAYGGIFNVIELLKSGPIETLSSISAFIVAM